MSAAEGFVYCIGTTLIFGFLIYRLVYGRNVGGSTRATVLERAEKRREVAGNLVNGLLFLAAMIKLTAHLGWLALSLKAALIPVVGIPLLLAIAVYLKTRLDVKRASAVNPEPI